MRFFLIKVSEHRIIFLNDTCRKKKIIFLYYITGLNVRCKGLSEEKNLKIKNKLMIYIYESIRVMFFDRHQQLALDLF